MNLPPSCRLVALDVTGSTNDEAKRLAHEGAPSGTLVWAKAQTAGRGRHGNTWESLSGNLLMSLLLRPKVDAARLGQLSFLAAVALSRALQGFLPSSTDIALKWPNDVLLDGKKVAGILLESEWPDWVVIGIGVNIAAAPAGATCLKALKVENVAAAQVLESLAGHIMTLYNEWLGGGFAPVRAEWLSRACNIGKTINVRLSQEKFSGTFMGIDDTGALKIELPGGVTRLVTSGEVFTG